MDNMDNDKKNKEFFAKIFKGNEHDFSRPIVGMCSGKKSGKERPKTVEELRKQMQDDGMPEELINTMTDFDGNLGSGFSLMIASSIGEYAQKLIEDEIAGKEIDKSKLVCIIASMASMILLMHRYLVDKEKGE